MSSSQPLVADRNMWEDPLAYLPCSPTVEYKKGQFIYQQNQPSTDIYLVVEGRVKISRVADDGRQMIMDIYLAEDFFGESALLGLAGRPEQAVAIENVRLMAWTAQEIESITQMRPRLALGLLQIVIQRSLEYRRRIESFSADNIGRRLAQTLIRLSQRLGVAEPDGSCRMGPFTHEFLAQYVGTSRELITGYMNLFRREGYLQYSRQGIVLFRDSLDEWLCRTSTHKVKAIPRPRAIGEVTVSPRPFRNGIDHIWSPDDQTA